MSEQKLEQFKYFVPPNNTTGGITPIVITPLSVPIASITIHSDSDDVINLKANVGWQAINNQNNQDIIKVDVIFEIWRDQVGVDDPIFTAKDSAQERNINENFIFDNLRVTTFDHVDTRFNSEGNVTYILTVRLGTGGASAASVIGPITFFGEEIDTD